MPANRLNHRRLFKYTCYPETRDIECKQFEDVTMRNLIIPRRARTIVAEVVPVLVGN